MNTVQIYCHYLRPYFFALLMKDKKANQANVFFLLMGRDSVFSTIDYLLLSVHMFDYFDQFIICSLMYFMTIHHYTRNFKLVHCMSNDPC